MAIRVAIVEDDLQTREGLQTMLYESDEIICLHLFEDAESFENKLKHLTVDVVLMDIHLPGLTGIESVERAKELRPDVEFLMCTHFEDADIVYSSLRVGAAGYILKNISAEKLIEAIKDINAGGSPMSPQIARKVTEAFATDKRNTDEVDKLTKKEREIINLIALGYQYKHVADKLSISIETVRTYIRDIYIKLQVHNKTEAINKLYPKTGF